MLNNNAAYKDDSDAKNYKQHFLYPGTIVIKSEPHQITTVLGSCIAVCLWDQERRMGGMNHYLLPQNGLNDCLTPRYGNIAISHLLQRILNSGGKKKNLVAKIFGGATVLQNAASNISVGSRNIQIAYDILKWEKIKLISQDVGGHFGRKIMFNTLTGAVWVKRLQGNSFLLVNPATVQNMEKVKTETIPQALRILFKSG